jgi:hypothetical protein
MAAAVPAGLTQPNQTLYVGNLNESVNKGGKWCCVTL